LGDVVAPNWRSGKKDPGTASGAPQRGKFGALVIYRGAVKPGS
jgi:hypothetical protein